MRFFFFLIFFLFQNYLSAYQYAVLVNKEKHILNVYEWNESGELELISSYAAITGKEKGNKKERGDLKTPEGIYFVTTFKTKSQMQKAYGSAAKKYGDYAFVLNYPNVYDEGHHKTGGGIWIHGVDSNERVLTPFDTEGCVALANYDINDLKQYIQPYQTPIVIVDSMKFTELGQIFSKVTTKHEQWIYKWKNAWEDWDQKKYQEFYSKRFRSSDRNKDDWVAYKEKLAEITNKNISIKIKNPKIVEFKDQMVLTFEQKYSSPLKTDEGKKSLYLQKENKSFTILAEEFHSIFNWK